MIARNFKKYLELLYFVFNEIFVSFHMIQVEYPEVKGKLNESRGSGGRRSNAGGSGE